MSFRPTLEVLPPVSETSPVHHAPPPMSDAFELEVNTAAAVASAALETSPSAPPAPVSSAAAGPAAPPLSVVPLTPAPPALLGLVEPAALEVEAPAPTIENLKALEISNFKKISLIYLFLIASAVGAFVGSYYITQPMNGIPPNSNDLLVGHLGEAVSGLIGGGSLITWLFHARLVRNRLRAMVAPAPQSQPESDVR